MLRPHPQPSPANIDIHRTPWNNFLNPRMFSSVVLKAQIYKRIEYSYLNVLVVSVLNIHVHIEVLVFVLKIKYRTNCEKRNLSIYLIR